ncbi:hypothetical protein [Embleya sp. NPDC059237]|uniref:hypothetical protein n=1 Tax=Embleya sp. NPDC059237 TaxID=3346784 RepID=UPI00367CD430
MTTRPSFLGIPVSGDIPGDKPTPQRPLEDLRPILQALLDDPAVHSFGWHQFTPFYNDGEPCRFTINRFWVRTQTDPLRSDVDDLEVFGADGHPTLGQRINVYGKNADGAHTRIGTSFRGPDEAAYDRAAAATAVECGTFDAVLLEAFGDSTAVSVHKDHVDLQLYRPVPF